jgi:hypothetical protein
MPLEITYWTGTFKDAPVPEGDISSESRSLSASSAQSAAAPTGAAIVSIYATEAARFAVGTNPTATSTSAYIASGERLWRPILAGQKIAGITA